MKCKNIMTKCRYIEIKKCFLIIIVISLIAMPLMACKSDAISVEKDQNTRELDIDIVTTIFAPYDFARQIVGDKGNVSMLIPPGAESHSYEPSPQDIIKIQNCDVFIFTGGKSDQWIEDVLKSVDTSHLEIIRLMECVDTVEKENSEAMVGLEVHNHDHEKEYDEHVWTSPENAIDITKVISKTVSEIDNKNSDYYKENTDNYLKKLTELSTEFRDITQSGKRKTIVFGDRFPFRYFTDEYGLKHYAAFPGCSNETEPSVATITCLTDFIKKEKIPVVFYIESSNHKIADMICEETGAKALLFHSCHNLSNEEMKDGKTYIEIMEQNAENLKEALE